MAKRRDVNSDSDRLHDETRGLNKLDQSKSHVGRADITNSSNPMLKKQSSKLKDLSSRLRYSKSITTDNISNTHRHALDESDSLIDPGHELTSKQIRLKDKSSGTGETNNETESIDCDSTTVIHNTIIVSDDSIISISPENSDIKPKSKNK